MLILDTDHVTMLQWAESEEALRLWARLEQAPGEEHATTIISDEEQSRGWLTYLSRARTVAQEIEAYRRLDRHLETYRAIKVLTFDDAAGAEYQRLRRARVRIGTMDLKIAAIALAYGATLLSRNLSDFRQVPDLRVEDWTT